MIHVWSQPSSGSSDDPVVVVSLKIDVVDIVCVVNVVFVVDDVVDAELVVLVDVVKVGVGVVIVVVVGFAVVVVVVLVVFNVSMLGNVVINVRDKADVLNSAVVKAVEVGGFVVNNGSDDFSVEKSFVEVTMLVLVANDSPVVVE